MRTALLALLLPPLALFGATPAGAEGAPPAPDVARVLYAKPDAYLAIPARAGDAGRIRSIAQQLQRPEARDTLAAIGRWIRRNLRNDPQAAYAWRTFEQMQKDGTYGSCADHAVAFGVLARACGVPTAWVKTLDVDWILARRAGREEAATYRGHVFLEVFLDGRWMLLDAEAGLLHERYDPATRILPGHRLAYDKGGEPWDLVLSCRWEDWKAQTDAYVAALDLDTIPWSRPRDLMAPWRLHAATGGGEGGAWVREVARALRYDLVSEFSQNFDRWLPRARGATLVVLCEGGRPALPEALWAEWLPADAAAWAGARGDGGPDARSHALADGTRVVLVRAEDAAGVQKALMEALR